MNLLLRSVVSSGLLLTAPAAFANTGWCSTVGGPHEFQFDYNKTLTTSLQNQAGAVVPDAYTWSLSRGYGVTCDCTTRPETLFKAEFSPSLPYITTVDGGHYYGINETFAVSAAVSILNQGYVSVPFSDVSNNYTSINGCNVVTPNSLSGGAGKLSLYFIRAASGKIVIPKTPIVKLYGSTIRGSYSAEPMAIIFMQGSITVPQTCTINAGQIIQVNFDDISKSHIKSKGSKGQEKSVNIIVKCNNISDGVNLALSLNGTQDGNDTTALATSNNDIGIKIRTETQDLTPNENSVKPVFDYETQQANMMLYAYPVNTSGAIPELGEFNATVTVEVKIN